MKEKKKSIKILAVLPFFYPHKGGSQTYAEEIFAKMAANHPEIEVDILCYNTDGAEPTETYRGLKIHRIPCLNLLPGRFALPCPFALTATLIKFRQEKYDFINTHIRFFDPTWWVWIYAKLIGAKSIFTGHCASHPHHKNKLVQAVAKLIDLTIAKFSLKFYDFITVTNHCAGEFFKNTLGIKKYHLIYGGVDTSFFSPKLHPRQRKIPNTELAAINPDTTLITYVGRLIWTKGVTYLYDAAREVLTRSDQKIVFVFAGPGELEKELKNRIKKDNLEDKIVLPGHLNRNQVKGLLVISDIFTHPSHHNEGFPNTILEAGASGCFVIATDNAGTKEVVKNKETGLLIPQKDTQAINDTLLWALGHPKERVEMTKKMRKMLVDRFDWGIISEQFYGLLETNKKEVR